MPHRLLTVGLILALLCAGCVSVPPSDGAPATLDGKRLTQRELRIRLYDFVVRFSSAVETAAEEVAGSTAAPQARAAALEWRANAIPACQAAAFDSDPAVGLVDVWTLVVRMEQFFAAAPAELADLSAVGVATGATLATEIEAIVLELEGAAGAASRREEVSAFAAAYPLANLRFERPAALPVFNLAQRASSEALLEVAATADERLDDTADRLVIYTESIPKQVRWQAELLVDAVLRRPELASLGALPQDLAATAIASVEAALVGIDQQRVDTLEFVATERLELTSELDRQRQATLVHLAGERAAVVDSLERERRAVTDDLDRQRVATLEQLATERQAVVAALATERAALTDDIDRQRVATLEHLTAEREAVLAWFADERDSAIDYANAATGTTGERLMDRAFGWLAMLLAAPLALGLLALLILRPRLELDFGRSRRPS